MLFLEYMYKIPQLSQGKAEVLPERYQDGENYRQTVGIGTKGNGEGFCG